MNKETVAFWFGTEAEVLKSFLVILNLRQTGYRPKIISTGQNDLSLSEVVTKYDLKPDLVINKFRNKKLPLNLIIWFFHTLFLSYFKMKIFINNNNIKYFVVHGDTVSTVMGAIIGRLYSVKIIHLEAGLRSHNLLSPFPEELDRILVGKLARFHFCQDDEAINNLKSYRGEKIKTFGNVVCDTVDMMVGARSEIRDTLNNKYALISFHRSEQVLVRKKLDKLVRITLSVADKMQVLFVLFEFTEQILKKNGMFEQIINHPNIIITPRVQYSEFITLMSKADMVVTDGGSNQEELAHLGVPTLIMRNHTERSDGLSSNVVLSKFDDFIINNFINNYESMKVTKRIVEKTPAKIVSDYLLCLK